VNFILQGPVNTENNQPGYEIALIAIAKINNKTINRITASGLLIQDNSRETGLFR
jgi:hypothetical protein